MTDDPDQPTIDLDVPPDEPMPSDIGMQPTADNKATFTYQEDPLEPGAGRFFEDVELREKPGLNRGIRLTMTPGQMRRWTSLFRQYIRDREQALDSDLGDAWGMYVVTVEEYPRGTKADQRQDTDPITARTVATCWTERAAQGVKASIRHGDHPDFDPLDFDRGDYYPRIDVVPLIGEDQDPPWMADD